jgi:uroporphyrinogen III methyltransferase / synthase
MASDRHLPAQPAIVYLVGAGPGDPGLITARALELIASADVVLYDRLIPAGALEGARADAELRYVGKRPGAPSLPQEEISGLLVEHAQAGRSVVRLKGGDPFVFGRGGEEAQALSAAGIPFEVVPGVTSGLAAAAYAAIPVTHRGGSSAVALVTGHEDPDKAESDIDWDALAAFPGTLVLYMGVGRLAEIAARLLSGGRSPDEAAAVIERGTLPTQRTVSGTLSEIADTAREAGVRAPAVTVVGPVAGLRNELAWLERRPLHGLTVAVTRARAQASALSRRLRDLGADVVEAPAIRIVPRPAGEGEVAAAVGRIEQYGLICLTSPNGAGLLLEALAAAGRDARALPGATVAAIGPGTARVLTAGGIRPEVVPERSVAEALVEALEAVPVEGRDVLIARAAEARDVLPEALRARGARVEVVALYDTVAEPLAPETLEALGRADYVTFTASSTVDRLTDALAAAGARLPSAARVASIGPVTSAAARRCGLEVAVEAKRHDIDGLVDALVRDAASRPAAAGTGGGHAEPGAETAAPEAGERVAAPSEPAP